MTNEGFLYGWNKKATNRKIRRLAMNLSAKFRQSNYYLRTQRTLPTSETFEGCFVKKEPVDQKSEDLDSGEAPVPAAVPEISKSPKVEPVPRYHVIKTFKTPEIVKRQLANGGTPKTPLLKDFFMQGNENTPSPHTFRIRINDYA